MNNTRDLGLHADEPRKPEWPSVLTAKTRVFPSESWTMSAVKHAVRNGVKFAYHKGHRLPREQLNEICGRMMSALTLRGMFVSDNIINSDTLHLDDDHLRRFAIGAVDRHRQGAFIA